MKRGHLHKICYLDIGADISPCGKYRYELHRIWNLGHGICTFIGLNPSTADASQDDPTIRRCVNWARTNGYKGIRMLNLFAYRATDPKELRKVKDPYGVDPYRHLTWKKPPMWSGDITIAMWGDGGNFDNAGEKMQQRFSNAGIPLGNFGITKRGQPRHILYLPRDVILRFEL